MSRGTIVLEDEVGTAREQPRLPRIFGEGAADRGKASGREVLESGQAPEINHL